MASGGNGSAVSYRSTIRSSKSIAIAECVLLGCLCILLSTVLSICSTELLLHYTDEETQMVFKRAGPLNIAGYCCFWVHTLTIRSYKSVIAQDNTVVRFSNDDTGENDEMRVADTSRSTMPARSSTWRYTCALGLVLSALLVYAELTGRVPYIVRNPTVYLLFVAGTFFYAYRACDLRTNAMIVAVAAFLITTIALGGESQSDRMDVVGFLVVNFLVESYSYLFCTLLEPSSAISGSYAPPVFTSQTGTGSHHEEGRVQEALICGRPTVTHSNSTHDAHGVYSIVKDVESVEDAEGTVRTIEYLFFNVHVSVQTCVVSHHIAKDFKCASLKYLEA